MMVMGMQANAKAQVLIYPGNMESAQRRSAIFGIDERGQKQQREYARYRLMVFRKCLTAMETVLTMKYSLLIPCYRWIKLIAELHFRQLTMIAVSTAAEFKKTN
mmetsp:Transcript_48488/g.128271  ORF Transcript_48488/g.128271 Transcript_48488/m.128271 type:complete len:104 (-) Transcript_48488:375-686(-)